MHLHLETGQPPLEQAHLVGHRLVRNLADSMVFTEGPHLSVRFAICCFKCARVATCCKMCCHMLTYFAPRGSIVSEVAGAGPANVGLPCGSVGVSGCRGAGVQGCRGAGVRECRRARVFYEIGCIFCMPIHSNCSLRQH